MDTSDIRFATSGDVHLAYQRYGAGPDVVGLAVNLAARVMAVAAPGTLYASSTVRDLLMGSGRALEDRGDHELKGIEGRWRLFEVRT